MGGNPSSQDVEGDLVRAWKTNIPSTKDEVFDYLKNTKSVRDQTAVNRGNPDAVSSHKPGKSIGRYCFIGPSSYMGCLDLPAQ